MVTKNWPSFSQSMQFSRCYTDERQEESTWTIVEDRYNKIKSRPLGEQKIPKILHQVWLGGNMPAHEQQLCEQVENSLEKDWTYKLWTEDNIQDLQEFKNIDLYSQTPNYGQKSDLLRYAILHEFGGVYMDTDFIPIKSFNNLLDLDFFCGVAYDEIPNIFNGLIGSSPNNDIIKSLLNLDQPLQYHTPMILMDSTGPFFLTRKIFQHIQRHENVVVLPNSFFYPFPNQEKSKTLGSNYKEYIQPESICCHLWAGSWM